jgi:type IX secretion system PorP/SprF family membrane protein
MKHVLLAILVLLTIGISLTDAQQVAHNSQYMHNLIVYNPAMAGASSCGELGLNVRKQWVGIPTSPFNQSGFIHGRIKDKHGLGLVLFNDVAGVANSFGAELAYAFHPVVAKDRRLSLGLSITVEQYSFTEAGFDLRDQVDPIVTYGVSSAIKPDIAFGFYYNLRNFNVGLGARQLLSSMLVMDNVYFLKRHYFLHMAFEKEIQRKYTLEPSLFIKGTESAKLSFDFNLKARYNNNLLTGLSFRYQEGLVGFIGYDTGKFKICYNYDLVVSRLFRHNSGSHEIFIGYTFCSKKKGGGKGGKKGAVPCPAYS